MALAADDLARMLLPSVLLVEDDRQLGGMLQEMLAVDYRMSWARSLGEARGCIADNRYDALIVDRRLPDGDGLELLTLLRTRGLGIPVLMLTALSSTDDVVRGLDSGANDYLAKPFHMAELQARLRALLRGFTAQGRSVVIGDWLLKPEASDVEDPQGHTIPLTITETRLLATLARDPDHVFTRTELLAQVFAQGSDPGTVDVYVSYIRNKTTRDMIDTVRGRGYRIGTPE
ncbi:response regulator transcription factor [Bifidobacterium thermophilum]|uniref:response regulator transcription factor n=1 Tax=Bifidobacterium thermophilum TaxID=33905 RepID=UPI0030B6F180